MMPRWLLCALALGFAAFACNLRWPASMEDHPAPGPQEGARLPPALSVPVGGVEVVEDREDVEDLSNPYRDDRASVERGAHLFAHYCTPCHGAEGRGGGKVSEKVPPAPDLRHISICRRTDGFLYGTLTAGGRAMPLMREGLTSKERWDLVAFVRSLQKQGCTGSAEGIQGEQDE